MAAARLAEEACAALIEEEACAAPSEEEINARGVADTAPDEGAPASATLEPGQPAAEPAEATFARRCERLVDECG